MVWKVNRIGIEQTWYSEEDIQQYKDKLNHIKNVCTGLYTRSQEANSIKKIIIDIIEKDNNNEQEKRNT